MDLLDDCKCGKKPTIKPAGEKQKHRIKYVCSCGESSPSGVTIAEVVNNWNRMRRCKGE